MMRELSALLAWKVRFQEQNACVCSEQGDGGVWAHVHQPGGQAAEAGWGGVHPHGARPRALRDPPQDPRLPRDRLHDPQKPARRLPETTDRDTETVSRAFLCCYMCSMSFGHDLVWCNCVTVTMSTWNVTVILNVTFFNVVLVTSFMKIQSMLQTQSDKRCRF